MAPQTIREGDLVAWANHHEGSDEAKWTAQDASNSTQEDAIRALTTRVGSMERRLLILAGFAAGFGGAAGQLITGLFA